MNQPKVDFSKSPFKMKMYNIFPILLLMIVLTLNQKDLCRAQNSPQDYLVAHNAARAQVGVGPMVWDEKVAAYARNYVNQRIGDCNLVHSQNNPYGENIARGSGDFLTGKYSVDLWVAEKSNYNYSSNSCLKGECGHYTQIVWRSSVRLGCAWVPCRNGWFFVSCNYDPPGNYIGERPY